MYILILELLHLMKLAMKMTAKRSSVFVPGGILGQNFGVVTYLLALWP